MWAGPAGKPGIAGTQNNHCVFATLREVGYAGFILLRSVARPASWRERRALAGEKEDLTSWKKTCLVRLKSG